MKAWKNESSEKRLDKQKRVCYNVAHRRL